MTDQPQITSLPDVEAYIVFQDPCLDPELVAATPQTDPQIYDYTSQFPSAQFYLAPFDIEPPNVCTINFACQVISGDRLDLCSINDGTSQGIFDPATGNYEFYSIDRINYKPGVYTFEITGTVGTKSATVQFVLTLKDPCQDTLLTVNVPDPFSDQTYVLRDPQINQIWNINNLTSRNTLLDCGPLTVSFFYNDG